MEKLAIQINDFSRKRLLMKMLPLTIVLSTVCYYLHSTQLFANFFSLIVTFWLIHPYLINFEQETTDYFKYLKDQEIYYQQLIDKKKRKLKKYKKIKPLDLDHTREEFARLTKSLQHNQKEAARCSSLGFNDDFYLDFQRDLKRRIIRTNDVAIFRKKLIIQYLKKDIRNLENKKNNIISTEHFVLQKAIPKG